MPSRTKNRIAETLFEILQRKPLDKITVKELVEECEVTRQTFYYHFQDLMDVLEWSVHTEMERVGAECQKEEDPMKALRIFIAYAFEARTSIEKLFASQHRAAIEKMMVGTVRRYLRDLAIKREALENVSAEDAEVALDFYTFAIVGTLLSASLRHQTDVDALARQLYQLMYGRFLREETDNY